jgi:hypothetical protein
MLRLALVSLFLLSSGASAQSSLIGFEGATLTLDSTGSADLSSAYLITAHHGLQLDASLEPASGSLLASAAAHLYLIPENDRRYGAFIRFSDLDDAPIWAIEAGIEGVWEREDTTIGLRAGAGPARPGALDYIFASAVWERGLSDAFSLSASTTVAEFDEANISAIGTQAEVALNYQQPDTPFAVTVGYRADALTGCDTRASLFLAASYTFGQKPAFASPDPLAGIWSRGLVGN